MRVERQDLDEMLGNLIENAAKYGHGRVFVTVEQVADQGVEIAVEDDGPGIPRKSARPSFARGARLDTTGKPGTGLGLAIVRDVAEIYGGSIRLEESEDLGGLLARLTLPPRAEPPFVEKPLAPGAPADTVRANTGLGGLIHDIFVTCFWRASLLSRGSPRCAAAPRYRRLGL